MTIGERIKKRRELLKLSQEELAEKIGYKSKTSIHKAEQGITDLPQSKIFDFAKVLKCSPAYLMGWKESLGEDPFEYMCRKTPFLKKHFDELGKEEPFDYTPTKQEQLLNTISFRLHDNSAAGVLDIENTDKVSIVKEGEGVIAEYHPRVIINAYLAKKDKESFSLEDLDGYINAQLTSNAIVLNQSQYIAVPVYGKASAGNGYINMETSLYDKVIHINGYSHDSFLIEVSGDSMEPAIVDGEFVLVDPTCNEIQNGKIFVVTFNDETFIKKIEDHGDIILLKSVNTKYGDIMIRQEQFEGLKLEGRVVKVISERTL